MKKHHTSTQVKPHMELRQLLVDPKDKINQDNTCEVMYEIPCSSCNKTYIGETGRSFSTQQKEHQKDCEKKTSGTCTQAVRERAEQENLKSAVSDHCKRENHVVDWEKARVIRTESNKFHRWIREAIEIRKRAHRTVNWDEGAYMLLHTWDAVLKKLSNSRGRSRPVGFDSRPVKLDG